ncbi:hypothetical protein GA0115253_101953 [Streptomyces sp. Termitarium-T10T-6]|nr:hypothetical protein GA0115253_101953 [Streptomyces sp. Termitarium-T10T-6]
MILLPASYPLECQIVAQHVPVTSSGIHTGFPARPDTATTASARERAGPASPSSGPAKMRLTQAG